MILNMPMADKAND